MFYFTLNPYLRYHWFLIIAAVVPAVFLMIRVYRSDRLEKESPGMLLKLAVFGVLSSLAAMVVEKILSFILGVLVPENTVAYHVILYFVIVAFAEEISKFIFLKFGSWHSPEFNCQYDGVVYAVFVSLGFALWENISYVLNYGFTTAIVRAVTAIPGHASFGVFMGIFYGIAKKYSKRKEEGKSLIFRYLAVLVPALLHGTYDYIATLQEKGSDWMFLGFIAVLFVLAFFLVGRSAKKDQYIA